MVQMSPVVKISAGSCYMWLSTELLPCVTSQSTAASATSATHHPVSQTSSPDKNRCLASVEYEANIATSRLSIVSVLCG